VVCVDLWDAVSFCKWATTPDLTVFLPNAELWDYSAAGGQSVYSFHKAFEAVDPSRIKHRLPAPSAIDRTGSRDNLLGLSDDREMYRNPQSRC
jgi:hypothetical protein